MWAVFSLNHTDAIFELLSGMLGGVCRQGDAPSVVRRRTSKLRMRESPPELQESEAEIGVAIDAPEANRVEVCHAYHAYTCQMKTPYEFTSTNIAEITSLMRKIKRNDSPAEERRAIAYAIGLMEKQVGAGLGIHDKAGMQWTASGDPTQQDCVDESTNTTRYLMVLQANGLLRYHTVEGPLREDKLRYEPLIGRPVKYWPHYTATVREKTGQRYAVAPGLATTVKPIGHKDRGLVSQKCRFIVTETGLAPQAVGRSPPRESRDAWSDARRDRGD
jgi:hypothetical protein